MSTELIELYDQVATQLEERVGLGSYPSNTYAREIFVGKYNGLVSVIHRKVQTYQDQTCLSSTRGWYVSNSHDALMLGSRHEPANHLFLLSTEQRPSINHPWTETRHVIGTQGWADPIEALTNWLVAENHTVGPLSDYYDLFGLDANFTPRFYRENNPFLIKEKPKKDDVAAQDQIKRRLLGLTEEIPTWKPHQEYLNARKVVEQYRDVPETVLAEVAQDLPPHVQNVLKKYYDLYERAGKTKNGRIGSANIGALKAYSDLLKEWGFEVQLRKIRKSIAENSLSWNGTLLGNPSSSLGPSMGI